MDIHDRDEFRRWLLEAAGVLNLSLDDSQIDRLYQHLNLVLLANEEFNLTRVTDPAEAAVRLAGDSLSLLPWGDAYISKVSSAAGTQSSVLTPQSSLRVLDMGTGAGYPAIPLAICRPDWTVTAIDTVGKKIHFVGQAAAQLGLGNLLAEQIQAREWHGRVAPFDLVVTRAMGDLAMVIREGARLLTPAGRLVSYHADEVTPEEQKSADKMLSRYKMHQVDSFEYTLPAPKKSVTRRLIVMAKQSMPE